MVRPYYAMKCNQDPMLLKWLAEKGTGFDCASGTELQAAARLFDTTDKFAGSSIFANPCKPPRDLRIASELQSGPTVVDSVEEIEKLNNIGWRRGSLIRIAVDDMGSKMPFSKKFGAALADVPKIQSAAKKLKQDIFGISFHVGSGCQEPLQYSKAIQAALLSLQGTSSEAKIVDIGGGFDANPKMFIEASHFIRESIKSIPPELKINWIAEPGRFMATEFQDLFVPVIGKKPAPNGNGWRYTIDESIYGQFSCIPFDRAEPKWLRVKMKDREVSRKFTPGVLFGRTCDSVDMIAQSESMEELEVGDWLWFPHMGAYTSVSASEFNGFPKPKTYYVDDSMPFPILMGSQAWPDKVRTVSHVVVPK